MAGWLRRRWFAVGFLAALVVADVLAGWTSSAWQAAVTGWASTDVVNLEHHPIGSLVLSAVVTGDHPGVWPLLAAAGLITADRLLGPARALLLCGSAQVLGTLISEGIVAYRVHGDLLPASALSQLDVGPSYVVVSALTLAVLAGNWRRRTIALGGLLALSPYLFTGLSRLDVAAVGHLVSIAIGMAAAATYQYHRGRRLRSVPEAAAIPDPRSGGAATSMATGASTSTNATADSAA